MKPKHLHPINDGEGTCVTHVTDKIINVSN